MNIKPPDYKYCPFCSLELGVKVFEKERKYCSSCDWIYYPYVAQSVMAIIIKDNQALMVKRAREPYKDSWMFPAGFIDFAEHPEEAIKREVKEETGLDIKRNSLLKIYQCSDDPRAMGHIIFCYQVEVIDGKLITDKNENKDIGWFNVNDLPKIGWKIHQQVAKTFLK